MKKKINNLYYDLLSKWDERNYTKVHADDMLTWSFTNADGQEILHLVFTTDDGKELSIGMTPELGYETAKQITSCMECSNPESEDWSALADLFYPS